MSKYVMPPRQKMINLIYIILIAILAINISKDAIEGYDIISNDYRPQIVQLQTYNKELKMRLEQENPVILTQVQSISNKTGIIRQKLSELKERIAQKADEKDFKSGVLKNKENIKVVTEIFIDDKQGAELKDNITAYKHDLNSLLTNNAQKKLFNSYLNVTPQTEGASWEKATFSYLTANAGIALLDKMEVEVLNCEKEALSALRNGKESEVTKETPQEPTKVLENQVLINGIATDILPDGSLKNPLVQVIPEVVATLYKGYPNKLQLISIGIANNQLKVSMKNGKVTVHNNQYTAIPDPNSQAAGITVSNNEKVLAYYEYKVKNLPTPQPYISYPSNGKNLLYKGNVPFSKNNLLNMNELIAQANEGPEIKYKVVSFETVFIKAGSEKVITLKNKGNKFSDEQKKTIEQLQAGDKLYITSITVSGGQKANEQIGSINVVLY